MRRACGEERPPAVEEEVAGRVQAGANLEEEIPLLNIPPQQAAGDDRPVGAPEAAAQPRGIFEPRQPITPAEEIIQIQPAGNRPFHRNVRRQDEEARMGGRGLQLDATYPEDMTKVIALLFLMLIVSLCIGHTFKVISYELGWIGNQTQDEPTPVTDMFFNVTTPMTTTIFNVTSSDFN